MTVDTIPDEITQRAIAAYLGLALGDALGATTEFLTPREIQVQYGVHRRIIGGGWLHLKPGEVTDDTEMSLALGEAILLSNGLEVTSVAEAFSRWMRSKPVDIGHTVRRGIIHYRNTGESSVPENEFDAGNGACMRCLPIALAYCRQTEQAMFRASRLQSHITHHNRMADAGTETVLAMLCHALRGGDRQGLRALAEALTQRYPQYRFDRRRAENPSGYIVHTLQAVFQALFAHDDFESTLVDVVNRGGDADTTGAIAGMIAGAFYGSASIPRKWLKALNPRVRQACESQALALLALSEKIGAGFVTGGSYEDAKCE